MSTIGLHSTSLSPEHLRRVIAAADLAGLPHYAAGLRTLYQRLYGFETVTGAHFRRSMDWAKTAPRLRDHLPGIATSVAGSAKRGQPAGAEPGTNPGMAAASNAARHS